MTAQAVRTLLEAKEPGGYVSGSVLTHAFEQLQASGYVTYTRYHGVVFTEAGEAAAAELIRHHRLLELFLVRILGVPLDQVNAEAEQLEHVLSEVVEERIDTFLGHPTEDPHGDPIPDPLGRVQTTPSIKLTQVAVGRYVTIQRITTENADLVRYLETLQLVPGTVVLLEARTPYGDVLTLRIGETPVSVSTSVADHLLARLL
jgi:DtxR family transcriptional regulator, Mn-dependent transcriptional regulator